MDKTIIRLDNIAKSFGNVRVIHHISFSIEAGKVYALAGENGAGKSTLCNIISGSLKPDEGTISYGDKEYSSFTIQQAKEIGIKMVHQELQILPLMNVEENIFIGEESSRRGFVNKKEMRKRSQELLEMVGLNAQPETKVAEIEIAGRQLLEIARAINHNARIIILDEPTSSLSQAEIRKFFTIIKKLKEQGVSFIFISHRLEEVFELADKIIVLKDGEKVAELNTEETNEKEVIRLMVGREYSDFYQRERKCHGDVCLELKDISGVKEGMLNNAYIPQHVSLKVEEGEVLGIAGLVGAGRTELVRMIFGEMPIGSGEIFVQGEKVQIKSSRDAIKLGIYNLPQEFEFLGRGFIFGIPAQVVFMVILVIICGIVLSKTLIGRYALAIGGNADVAKLAGISVIKYKLLYFVFCSLCASFAGMILTSRLATGQPNLASNMMMDTLTAVVLGGTAMSGGEGSIAGSVMGALLLTIISNGLTINGVNSFWQMIISALILIATIIARRKKD